MTRALLLALPALFVDTAARAADEGAVCVSAFEDAQRFRSNQRLLAAREALSVCARPVCPKVVADRCQKWEKAVEAALPSVALSIVDESGRPVAGGRVTIDDRVTMVPDDGVVTLDPGPHGARAEKPRKKPGEARFELKPGEKRRAVTLRLEPDGSVDPVASASATPRPPPTSKGINAAPYLLGGIGVVGIGVFAYLGLKGRSDEDRLSSTCSPRCSPEDVSSVRTTYIGADIALGLGVVSLGIATWLALSTKDDTVGVGVGPSSAVFRGRF